MSSCNNGAQIESVTDKRFKIESIQSGNIRKGKMVRRVQNENGEKEKIIPERKREAKERRQMGKYQS